MKITFTDNDGIILDTIEDYEIGDISKPIALAAFMIKVEEITLAALASTPNSLNPNTEI